MDTIADANSFVAWFRQSSPYIHAHRGKTFVVMLPGEAIAPACLSPIVHDLALLNGLGIRLVLVHGARPQINTLLQERNISASFHQGRRITDTATLDAVIDAVGKTRITLEAAFSVSLPNTPMHGAAIRIAGGNFVAAKPAGIIDGIDHLHTGDVRKIDRSSVEQGLAQSQIILLSCLGYSTTGEIFNLLAEDVAQATAVALNADKLIFYTAEQGLVNTHAELTHEITASELSESKIKTFKKSQESVIQAAKKACLQGISRSHIVSFNEDGALLKELFSLDGGGTLVTPTPYENIRAATIADVGGILELIEPLENNGVLVKRSRELLEQEINQFHVIERDGAIIACAALYPVSNEQNKNSIAEIACIVVHPQYRQDERGEKLMRAIYARARAIDIHKVFVLTTQTAHWFIELGFVEAELSALPQEKQALYNFQRNSKVFMKALS